nr:glycosyltransferase [Natrinema pallidum]
MSVGIVIPAFRPDVELLISYIEVLERELQPEEIRIELDDPQSEGVIRHLEETTATVATSSDRRGKGAAITAGFESLYTDILLFLDADGSTPVSSVGAVLQPVLDGDTDVSVGSRRHPKATVNSHQTTVRRFLGNGFSFLARRSLPTQLYDYQCGAKAMTAEAWDLIRDHLYEEDFAWDLEMLAIAGALNLSITEVPIRWEDRPGSTVDPVTTVLDFIRALIAVRHRAMAIQGHRIHAALPQSRSETLLNDD